MKKAAKLFIRLRIPALLAVTMLAAAFLFSACQFLPKSSEETGFCLYVLNQEEDQLQTVPYTPQSADTEGLIREVIAQTEKVPEDKSLARLLPEGIFIEEYRLEGAGLTLDFSPAYAGMTTGRELLVRGGVVREFLQIAGVDSVSFTVAGKDLKDSYGKTIGEMTNNSFMENSSKTLNSYQNGVMTLYFTDSTGKRLLPETRKVVYVSNESLEKAVVQEIIRGPVMPGRYPTFETGTVVLSVIRQDDVCYVNFAKGVGSTVLNVSEEVQVYSIVDSLVDTCDVERVEISIEGKNAGVFSAQMPLNVQYEKNSDLIDR